MARRTRAKQHPECLKGYHLWLIQRVGRAGTEIYACARCGDVMKAVPKRKE